MRSLLVSIAVVLASACIPTPPVTVVHVGKRGIKDDVSGDEVKLRRPAQESYSGIKGGAYVARTNEDWQRIWKAGAEPQAAPTHDPLQEMVVLVASEDPIVSNMKITR